MSPFAPPYLTVICCLWLPLRILVRPAAVTFLFILLNTGGPADAQHIDHSDSSPTSEISFQADIRPLLSDHCFQCHGPDENSREADLRLDLSDDATADRGGYRVIEPGDAESSEFVRRILSQDELEQMPPPSANKPLTESQRRLLTEWIQQGAVYEPHWAFVSPSRPAIPNPGSLGDFPDWGANPIDRFVLARMTQNALTPSLQADRETLARRVSLDLTGLPPTPSALKQYLDDPHPNAYEQFVDRLLASPHYGERWARPWLDLARYSDTNGYEKDLPRSMWPYRDWVIDALNDDMPFDQFTVAQLAGDMLANAMPRQQIATGFHRNTMTNQEGGVDPQEFRYLSVVDRVSTTGTTWMGLTIGCAQCHSHKFDPISQTEYYRLFAIFNNADEPTLELRPSDIRDQRETIDARISKLRAGLPSQYPVTSAAESNDEAARLAAFDRAVDAWISEVSETVNHWQILQPREVTSNLPIVEILDDHSVLATGDVTKSDEFTVLVPTELARVSAVRLEVIPDKRLPYGGPGRSSIQAGVEKGGDFYLSHFELAIVDDNQTTTLVPWKTATHSYAGPNRSAAAAIDGRSDTAWGVANRTAEPHYAVFTLEQPIESQGKPVLLRFLLRHESFYPAGLGRFRIAVTGDEVIHAAHDRPASVEDSIAHKSFQKAPEHYRQLREYFCDTSPALAEARKPIDQLRRQLPKWPTTLVMEERTETHQRITHRHHRGEYLQPREPVQPGVPDVLNKGDSTIQDRLAFARWLVRGDHPLTARVIVNRHWQQLFGRGLVDTIEDFGLQGSAPSHPKLLDWLAIEFVQQGWSQKSIHRLIVTSQTYRQSSQLTDKKWEVDPRNIWLSRSPRVRLRAEQVRDATLSAAGLLCQQLSGPAVFPPQPPGITEATYSPMKWNISKGGNRYRRGIYTFSKRTAPYAMFSLFDAPSGEACVAKRDRSNTPLQALTMLNDQVFVEAARALAQVAYSPDRTSRQIAEDIFRRCLQRSPQDDEIEFVIKFHQSQLLRFSNETGRAYLVALRDCSDHWGIPIPNGRGKTNVSKHDVQQLASWTLVARSILNLDEFVVRP